MKVQAWLEWIVMIFISGNLIVVLQFGNSLLQVHCNPLYCLAPCIWGGCGYNSEYLKWTHPSKISDTVCTRTRCCLFQSGIEHLYVASIPGRPLNSERGCWVCDMHFADRLCTAFCRSIQLTMQFLICRSICWLCSVFQSVFAKQIDFCFWHKCHSIVVRRSIYSCAPGYSYSTAVFKHLCNTHTNG